MVSPELSRKIANHLQEKGKFLPFTYSIGLESSLYESLNSVQNYPLSNPDNEEQFELFIKSLTFFHEATHLCQYTGTSFGLRALRFTNTCLSNLSKQKKWQLPILPVLQKKWLNNDLTLVEQKLFEGVLNLLDVQDQLTLHHYKVVNENGPFIELKDNPEYIVVMSGPWNPYFFLCEQDNESRLKFAQTLRKEGVYIRKLQRLIFYNRPEIHEVVINSALLMETFALLVEINHIGNAIDSTWKEIYELLPRDSRYYWLIEYLLQSKVCELKTIIPTLSVLIDASLMYDPYILFNTPWDTVDQEGRGDSYSGETFIRLCDAIKKTKKIKNGGPVEIGNFYKELCTNSGLPDPDWMVQKAFEKAETLFTKNNELLEKTKQKPLLYNAYKSHYEVLKFRLNEGCGNFLWKLTTSQYIFDIVEILLPSSNFYNISSNQPDYFDPSNVDIATIHSLLGQMLTENNIQCPLKMGYPFYCHSATRPPNKLCVWEDNIECLLDILENQFELIPRD